MRFFRSPREIYKEEENMMKNYIAEINADWGGNIITRIEANNQNEAEKVAYDRRNNYGDSEIESIVVSVEEVK